jgi:hypothetical protein
MQFLRRKVLKVHYSAVFGGGKIREKWGEEQSIIDSREFRVEEQSRVEMGLGVV